MAGDGYSEKIAVLSDHDDGRLIIRIEWLDEHAFQQAGQDPQGHPLGIVFNAGDLVLVLRSMQPFEQDQRFTTAETDHDVSGGIHYAIMTDSGRIRSCRADERG